MAGPKKSMTNQGGLSGVARFWWVGVILAAVVLGAWLTGSSRSQRSSPSGAQALPGYIFSMATVASEYTRFHSAVLHMPEVERQFQEAGQKVSAQDYAGAVTLLEDVSRQVKVPVIFNNLGVLYTQLNDYSRAVNAFRKALDQDINYQSARAGLNRLKGVTAQNSGPVTHEIEPNDRGETANLIAFGKPVDGEIAAGAGDQDYFRVTIPAPRDLLSIEVARRSKTLDPVLRLFDADQSLLEGGKETRQPGGTLTHYLSLPPNATIYLAVSGHGGTAGEYTLTASQLKAYDAYEPNDDIFSARNISVGQTIEANIMDAADTDYYSFTAPRTGRVSIQIQNRSTTLIPALSTFNPDKSSSGFGPDVRTAGGNLKHDLDVREGQTYYIQVWPQANSAGGYSLLLQ